MTRIWLAGVCALLVAGCSHVQPRQVYPRHYTLATTPAAAPTQVTGAGSLQITALSVPPWLDSTNLYYRLDYRGGDRIASYAESDWIAPPARLLEQALLRNLAASGAWRVVTGPAAPTKSAFALHIRLDDFSQVFTTPTLSHGTLDATATLIDNRDDAALAQRHFHIDVPASTADAAGGAAALNGATRQFTAELVAWLRAARPSARTATTPAPR